MKSASPQRIVPAVLFAILLGALATGARATPSAWQLLETPPFTVVSELDDQATRTWAGEFSQFIAELRRVFEAKRPNLPPLTVVLFAGDRDFRAYKPLRPDGRGPASIGGFFNHRGNWSVIGLAGGYRNQAVRELIFHEGVHWFTSNDPVVQPVWLSEGLAEVFSTFRQEDGSVRWGTDLPAHVRLLRTEPMIPFERFLFLTRDDSLFNESDRSGMFYAQAWAFVHYLMFGQRDGSSHALSDYFAALGTNIHPDDAFRQAFGQDYVRMGETLAKYVKDGHYYKVIRSESIAARITGPITIAPPAIVEVALARLAIGAARFEVARPHAARAVSLAPNQPGGYELLALLREEAGDHAGARAACARAVELGSKDASTLFLLAYLTAVSEMRDNGIKSPEARHLGDLYRRAIELCPTMMQAYQNLATLAPSLEPIDDDDIAVLRQGARRFPHRGEILVGLASMVARRGDRTTARALIVEARERGLPLDCERQARRLEEGWWYRRGNVSHRSLRERRRLCRRPDGMRRGHRANQRCLRARIASAHAPVSANTCPARGGGKRAAHG